MIVRYDVFQGPRDDAMWVDCAEELEAARGKMNVLAAQQPGSFFVYCNAENKIVAEIDTSAGGGHSAAVR